MHSSIRTYNDGDGERHGEREDDDDEVDRVEPPFPAEEHRRCDGVNPCDDLDDKVRRKYLQSQQMYLQWSYFLPLCVPQLILLHSSSRQGKLYFKGHLGLQNVVIYYPNNNVRQLSKNLCCRSNRNLVYPKNGNSIKRELIFHFIFSKLQSFGFGQCSYLEPHIFTRAQSKNEIFLTSTSTWRCISTCPAYLADIISLSYLGTFYSQYSHLHALLICRALVNFAVKHSIDKSE